ncbi:ABC-2 family transporter protein [Lacrimispora sp.]|uniref:ABC transporter permease n=1 Tax=Lacrimispora sp. TaxID=2719234 RepID=UPI0032E3761B
MNSVRLYVSFFFMHLKSMMQHKISFFMTLVGQFLISFNVFLGVYFMMTRFHQVNGFSYSEVLLCFSITLMAFTLAETVFRSLDTFETIIGNGEFDRILLRPKNSLFLVLCSKVDLTRFGRLIQAIVMLVYGICYSSINWTPLRCILVVLMILGGVCVFGSIYLIFACLCFFTLEGLEFMNVFTDGAREYGKYPIGIYGKTVLFICTYLVPFALFQYYPFLYLTGKSDNQWYSLLPLFSALFLIPAFLLWKLGLRHYQSTGS